MSAQQISMPEITDEQIARRAYELWQSRGCPEGDGSDDWNVAKDQLESERLAGCCGGSTGRKTGGLVGLLNRLRRRAAL